MARFRFNPSSNKYTEGGMDLLSKFVFAQFEDELKKKREAEQLDKTLRMYKELYGDGQVRDMGLFGEDTYSQSLGDRFKIPAVFGGDEGAAPLPVSTTGRMTFPGASATPAGMVLKSMGMSKSGPRWSFGGATPEKELTETQKFRNSIKEYRNAVLSEELTPEGAIEALKEEYPDKSMSIDFLSADFRRMRKPVAKETKPGLFSRAGAGISNLFGGQQRIAVNQKTGERLILKDNKWQPY